MTENKTLPGAMIRFTNPGSCGYHTNEYGVGSISLSAQRPGQEWPWLDLGHIFFSDPTPDQYKAATEVREKNPYGPDAVSYSDIHRRVSRTQASYIEMLISDMLNEKLNGVIPTDDEINAIMKERREIGIRSKIEENSQKG